MNTSVVCVATKFNRSLHVNLPLPIFVLLTLWYHMDRNRNWLQLLLNFLCICAYQYLHSVLENFFSSGTLVWHKSSSNKEFQIKTLWKTIPCIYIQFMFLWGINMIQTLLFFNTNIYAKSDLSIFTCWNLTCFGLICFVPKHFTHVLWVRSIYVKYGIPHVKYIPLSYVWDEEWQNYQSQYMYI